MTNLQGCWTPGHSGKGRNTTPVLIFTHDNNPLGALFLNSVRRYQHRVAIRSGNKIVTYGKLNEMAANFALHLAAYNVKRGSPIGLNLKTDAVQASVAIMAITFLGARWMEFQPISSVAHQILPPCTFCTR